MWYILSMNRIRVSPLRDVNFYLKDKIKSHKKIKMEEITYIAFYRIFVL